MTRLLTWLGITAFAACIICLLFYWVPTFGAAPALDAPDQFILVALPDDPAQSARALEAATTRPSEYVGLIPATTSRPTTMVFRHAAYSSFQREQLGFMNAAVHLSIVTAVLSLVGLVGLIVTFSAVRGAAMGQLYTRFHSILAKLIDSKDTYDEMLKRTTEKTETKFLRSAVCNLFEEIYLLRHTGLIAMIPGRVWKAWDAYLKRSLGKYHLAFYLGIAKEKNPEATQQGRAATYDAGFIKHCKKLLRESARPSKDGEGSGDRNEGGGSDAKGGDGGDGGVPTIETSNDGKPS